jgi:putative flippase GtrA
MRGTIIIIVKYTLFSLFAIVVNLLAQELFVRIMGHSFFGSLFIYFSFIAKAENIILWSSMGAGTFMGLMIKYILDKKYIFYHSTASKMDDGRKFILYAMMGVITTCIFWGMELTFFYAFPEIYSARYIGGTIGLSLGYVLKYWLDRKFVFVIRSCNANS